MPFLLYTSFRLVFPLKVIGTTAVVKVESLDLISISPVISISCHIYSGKTFLLVHVNIDFIWIFFFLSFFSYKPATLRAMYTLMESHAWPAVWYGSSQWPCAFAFHTLRRVKRIYTERATNLYFTWFVCSTRGTWKCDEPYRTACRACDSNAVHVARRVTCLYESRLFHTQNSFADWVAKAYFRMNRMKI